MRLAVQFQAGFHQLGKDALAPLGVGVGLQVLGDIGDARAPAADQITRGSPPAMSVVASYAFRARAARPALIEEKRNPNPAQLIDDLRRYGTSDHDNRIDLVVERIKRRLIDIIVGGCRDDEGALAQQRDLRDQLGYQQRVMEAVIFVDDDGDEVGLAANQRARNGDGGSQGQLRNVHRHG